METPISFKHPETLITEVLFVFISYGPDTPTLWSIPLQISDYSPKYKSAIRLHEIQRFLRHIEPRFRFTTAGCGGL